MTSDVRTIATAASLAHPGVEVLQADAAWSKVGALSEGLGFHCWGYSAAPSCYRPATMSLRISTYPREHIRSTVQRGLHPHGPAMAFAFRYPRPVTYKTVRRHTNLTPQVRAVLDLNLQHSVTRGMVIPVRNTVGMMGMFALAFDGTDEQLASLWEERGSVIVERLEQFNREILGRHARCFTRDFVPTLPERQLQIIQLLAHGSSNDELADTLHISIHTVNKQIAAIKERLGARTLAHATALAVQWGLV